MSELSPREIQLCHRIAADAFANSETRYFFEVSVVEDPRFLDLDLDAKNAILARAKRLRDHWLATGVVEPIKQNFLDDLGDAPVVQTLEANSMYAFEARFPIDHAIKLINNIRSGDFERGANLKLVGAIAGECGALLESGFSVGVMSADFEMPSTIDGCINALSPILEPADGVTAAAIPPWAIPVLLKLLELLAAKLLK